jgi:hypothetical protein
MGGMRNLYKILIRKPEGKKPRGRPRQRREDNFRMDLREIGFEGRLDASGLRYGPMAGFCEHDIEPSGSI